MVTRNEYLFNPEGKDRKELHQEYYMQFQTEVIRMELLRKFPAARLKKSKDPYFNDIPLSSWDKLAKLTRVYCPTDKMKKAGEFWTLSFGVCLLKSIARDVIS
jgi:hypothetical protein